MFSLEGYRLFLRKNIVYDVTIAKIKASVADPEPMLFLIPGSGIRILMKKMSTGSWIQDKHPGSTTLIKAFEVFF
jgi:hypothetical protein